MYKEIAFYLDNLKQKSYAPPSPLPGSNLCEAAISQTECQNTSEEIAKRRRISTAKEESVNLAPEDEFFTASPCRVTFALGVRIASVAAGGRHTLALSGIPTSLR